jgi:ABC-type nitrate/sulfonate/bicarbonate transport system substrate-binding protein
MSTPVFLKIGGVPEHFNLPWRLSIEERLFNSIGLELHWSDMTGGTGQMIKGLQTGSIDIAVLLTEGITKSILEGLDAKIVNVYVQTPLRWGVHVPVDSKFTSLSDLENGTFAISRFGSGSHLMAYVNAQNQNWNTESLQFEIVNTIDGAVEALTKGTADYFMWERFMTKPLVDRGIFRRVADCPTPWPCFVIAVRNEFLEANKQTIALLLETINNTTIEFRNIPSIDRTLASKYHQKLEDIQEWLSLTKWSQKPLEEKVLNKIQNQLFDLKIIDKKGTFAEIVKAV